MTQLATTLVVLVALYGLIVAGLSWLMRRLGLRAGRAVFLSCAAFGLGSGTLAALLWPHDSSVLANFAGVWLGDWMYVQAIAWLGDPGSPQAHYTIPWVLRVPQVHVLASTGLFALLGLLAQLPFGRSGER